MKKNIILVIILLLVSMFFTSCITMKKEKICKKEEGRICYKEYKKDMRIHNKTPYDSRGVKSSCFDGNKKSCNFLKKNEKKMHKISKKLKRSCDLKFARACLDLADNYEDGKDGELVDIYKFKKYLKKSCDLGNEKACKWIASLYKDGYPRRGILKNMKNAFLFKRRAYLLHKETLDKKNHSWSKKFSNTNPSWTKKLEKISITNKNIFFKTVGVAKDKNGAIKNAYKNMEYLMNRYLSVFYRNDKNRIFNGRQYVNVSNSLREYKFNYTISNEWKSEDSYYLEIRIKLEDINDRMKNTKNIKSNFLKYLKSYLKDAYLIFKRKVQNTKL